MRALGLYLGLTPICGVLINKGVCKVNSGCNVGCKLIAHFWGKGDFG